MSVMMIHPPTMRAIDSGTETLFVAQTPQGESCVRIAHTRSQAPAISPTMLGDAALALFLLPAMRLGLDLDIQSPVSSALMKQSHLLQDIFDNWYPDTFARPIAVHAPTAEPLPSVPGQACFFSGGVDSFYSVLKHHSALSHLVFVHGFDLALTKSELRKEVSDSMRAAAAGLTLPLVEVETDVRDFSDQHVHWGSHFCGAAMAAVAHLLSPWLGAAVIPATMSYAYLEPFGTHLYTDERWSSPAMTLLHDGMEARRIDKIRMVTSNDIARRHLRVCWENREGRYNCGVCEKCLRTMANLRALGQLAHCPTFPAELDLKQIEALPVDHALILPFLEETRLAAIEAGDEALATAVQRCQLNHEVRAITRELNAVRDEFTHAPEWIHQASPRFRDAILKECWQRDPEWTANEMGRPFTADRQAARSLLWKHERFWFIGQVIKSRLARLLPRWLRRKAQAPR